MDVGNIIIPQGKIAINLEYGRKLLNQYFLDLDQAQSISKKMIVQMMAERKAATQPKIVEVPNDRKPFLKDQIAIVNLNGMIRADDGWSSAGTRSIGEKLVEQKKNVIGAIFKISSGGGYMDGAEAMVSAMREFDKPIVVLSPYAASAAYMIASEADQINAETEFSEFGSIGVYIELDKEFKELYKEYVESAYSEKSPEKNKAFRDWVFNDDLSGFVKQATQADDMFMGLVNTNRTLEGSTKEETLAGGMFYAKDAKKRGMIDGFSNMEKSVLTIQKLSRI